MKRNFLRLVFLLLVVGGGLSLARIGRPQSPTTPLSLRYLASQNGAYVSYLQPNIFPRYPSLDELGLSSTNIVLATAGGNACHLSTDETTITTDYSMMVNTVYKGGLTPGTVIQVSVPGGRVSFPQLNGTSTMAEVRAPWFKKMSQGNQYYLFLTGASSTSILTVSTTSPIQHFETTGGPAGVFQVSNGTVTSNSGRLRDPMWQYNNVTIANFEVDIHHAMTSPIQP